MKKISILSGIIMLLILTPLNLTAQSDRVSANYLIDLVNPERKLFSVRAEFEFPSQMDSVVFTIDEMDNHYTESYSRYIRQVLFYTADSVAVPLAPIEPNGWIAHNVRGKYFLRYFVVIEHPLQISQYGIDETPFFYGTSGVLIGSAFMVYPMLESDRMPKNIKLKFDLGEKTMAALPNQLVGDNEYLAPGYENIMNAYWAIGGYDTLILGSENYPLRVAIQRGSFSIPHDHLIGNVRKIWDGLCDVFKISTEYQPLLIISEFPFVKNSPQIHNAGAASPGSINILLDPKLEDSMLDNNSGLFVYNLFSQWLPITFFPENRINFSWLIRGCANYYQLKLLAKTGLISELEFLDRLAFSYNYYSREFDQRNISVRAARDLPNAQGYVQSAEVLTAALTDLRLQSRSKAPCSLDALLAALARRFNGSHSVFTSQQFYELADTLSGLFLRPMLDSCINYNHKIDLPGQLRDFGVNLEKVSNAQSDIGIQFVALTDLTIDDLKRGGPGFNAGLEPGDKILKVDGRSVGDIDAIINYVLQKKIGSKLKIEYDRHGKLSQTSIKVGGIDKYAVSFMKERTERQIMLWNSYLAD